MNRSTKILLGIFAFLAIAGLIVGLVFYFKKDSTNVTELSSPVLDVICKNSNILKKCNMEKANLASFINSNALSFRVSTTSRNQNISLSNFVFSNEKYLIDWGDNDIDTSKTHTYTNQGNYIVKIYGTNVVSKVIFLKNNYLTDFLSYGNNNITAVMFKSAEKLVSVPEPPRTLTDMFMMFYGCSSFNQDLNSWDVSNVINMDAMFFMCSSFNKPLNRWNVSNVTTMDGMFYTCEKFDQDLSSWNVSKVTNMGRAQGYRGMFAGCSSFNKPLNSWDVSNVTTMSNMFEACISFNQDLSSWNVSKVTNMDAMFYGCKSFYQDLSRWDLSNVRSKEGMLTSTLIESNKAILPGIYQYLAPTGYPADMQPTGGYIYKLLISNYIEIREDAVNSTNLSYVYTLKPYQPPTNSGSLSNMRIDVLNREINPYQISIRDFKLVPDSELTEVKQIVLQLPVKSNATEVIEIRFNVRYSSLKTTNITVFEIVDYTVVPISLK